MAKAAHYRKPLSDWDAELLQRGGFVLEPEDLGKEDPRLLARAEHETLLRSSLSVDEAARRLGIEPSQILQRLAAHPPGLYGIRRGSSWILPDFQFDGPDLVPGFEEVAARLDPELHLLSVFRWFTLPNPDLPEDDREKRNLSPRDWLRSGRSPAPVAELATHL